MSNRLKDVESAILDDILEIRAQLEDCNTKDSRLRAGQITAELSRDADKLGETPDAVALRNSILANRDFDRIEPSLKKEPFLGETVQHLFMQYTFLYEVWDAARRGDYSLALFHFIERNTMRISLQAALGEVPRTLERSKDRDTSLALLLNELVFPRNQTPQ